MNPVHYDEMIAARPRYEDVAERYAEFQAVLEEDPLKAVSEWDALRRELSDYKALTGLKFAQDTRNEKAREEREYANEFFPRIADFETSLKRELLARRSELEADLGSHIFDLWRTDVAAFEPALEQDLVNEGKLSMQRSELVASAEIEFEGESLNLAQLSKFHVSGDRAQREASTRTYWDWFEARGDSFDGIYDELVSLRTSMAHKLGLKNYVELGYLRMQRIDYDASAVDRFRTEVFEQVVPLAAEAKKQQAAALGVETLTVWDDGVHDPAGSPVRRGDDDEFIANAHQMFSSMHPELAEFFEMMDRRGMMDLVSRKGKASGGFCTSLQGGVPFIFANFNGTRRDLDTFTHEMGHAFQCWASRSLAPIDLVWPTLESCEIHSMSLEFFCAPYMDLFYGDDADRVRRVHLTENLTFLPYGVAVDHFQHLVYENPDASPADRRAMWLQMEQKYLPWRNWEGIPHGVAGGMWHRQGHVFGSPFYYIDYVLAETVALQFWARMRDEPEAALADYVELCHRGGTAPFQELVRSASLQSPFERGCLESAVAIARETLNL